VTEVGTESVNGDGRVPRGRAVSPSVPWWFGRSAGVLLALVVGAALWTVSWTVATHVEAQPRPVSDQWEDPYPVSSSLSKAAGVDGQPKREEKHAHLHGSDVVPERTIDRGDRASHAQLIRERQAERIRQAKLADQQLAEFIASVGVVDVLGAWVPPLSGEYRITATFGQGGSLWSNDHTGVDLAAPSGTPVASVAAGTVTHTGDAGAYGLRVEVTHADGTETSYSHLSRIDVTEGQVVQQGAMLGAVGSTGNSTGPHLHLELTPAGGVPVDPVQALLAQGVAL
jgi:murein DD-endopeptidase MepM/ murein hydrolase activator NlpD